MIAYVTPPNARSRAVVDRLGMERVGDAEHTLSHQHVDVWAVAA